MYQTLAGTTRLHLPAIERTQRLGRYFQASAPAPLERDPLEHVRDRLTRVHGGLQRLEDVLPADHDHRVDAPREQRGDAVALQAVALVLQAVDLDQVRAQVLAAVQRSAAPRGSRRRRRRAPRRTRPPAPSALRPRRGPAGRRPARCSRRCRRARSPARSRRRRRMERAPAARRR